MHEPSARNVPEMSKKSTATLATEESDTTAVAAESTSYKAPDESSREAYTASDAAERYSWSNYLESGEAMWSARASRVERRVERADPIEREGLESIPESVVYRKVGSSVEEASRTADVLSSALRETSYTESSYMEYSICVSVARSGDEWSTHTHEVSSTEESADGAGYSVLHMADGLECTRFWMETRYSFEESERGASSSKREVYRAVSVADPNSVGSDSSRSLVVY